MAVMFRPNFCDVIYAFPIELVCEFLTNNFLKQDGEEDEGISELLFTYGDYLYPFSIEFSILIGNFYNYHVNF